MGPWEDNGHNQISNTSGGMVMVVEHAMGRVGLGRGHGRDQRITFALLLHHDLKCNLSQTVFIVIMR